ncbi:molybdate ABC transporter substrate-binding protein [Streptomyces sp. TRM 70351]|uniref:molybdate ABC transporter substrate-binding protein n=1 Tax=Streptomyces sp. TRM 70351 TaxID=3116552 RepID=UPI002E7B7871|nr:molybdate ABC transporter substrate-binding protein [Streptomyces sp. TRM 70351]MEE1930117.1 molybdate ABC transporter substrate-binding protein [Streptomyces sp. TRM 70351]
MTLSGTARRAAAALLAAVLVVPLAACGGARDDGRTRLTVLAAASLTDAFAEVGAAYGDAHRDTAVAFSFAGSQEVAAQVRHGAPADVAATADTATMDALARETQEPVVFAHNHLVIATAKGNPERVRGLADLARPGLRVVLAAPEVPVGRYGARALAEAGVTVRPVSQEPSVRAVLSKVELGEADAGVVYATDAAGAADAVDAVALPRERDVVARYPAAALTGSEHPREAREFVAWLSGPQAQRILRDAGFAPPEAD